jgi:hypothetical protein
MNDFKSFAGMDGLIVTMSGVMLTMAIAAKSSCE